MPRASDKVGQKVLYPHIEMRMFHADPEEMQYWSRDKKAPSQPLTEEAAKEILGWQTEIDAKVDFADDYLFIDYEGNKVRCLNNLANRPFYPHVAEAWKLEILRGKWKFNGETVIIDKHGNIHDGQHRLIGLVLACQAWREDQKVKPVDDQRWSQFWPEEAPYIETLLVLGIPGDDATVNTIGTGKPRTFTDVMYRSEYFDGLKNNTKKALAKTADWAIRVVWDRTAQKQVSYCPKRSHSESLEFISRHERILKAVRFIHELNQNQDKFQLLITLGTAAGLLYLMGSAASELEEYEIHKNEKGLNFKTWERAENFFSDLANNGKATEPLRELLLSVPPHVQGQFGKGLRIGLIIKAWNLYVDRKKLTTDAIQMSTYENTIGVECLGENPVIGGIDLVYEPIKTKKETVATDKKDAPAKKAESDKDECLKGSAHEWTRDDSGEYCAKCLASKEVRRKK